MSNPMLSVAYSGDTMRITLDVSDPIASMGFFRALTRLLSGRLDEVRAISPGELEIASWTAPPPTVETDAPHE